MKFNDLTIGQRFELDGAAYLKTSPVIASREDGGGNKFFARYTVVQPFDHAERRPAKRTDKMLSAETAIAAFDACHARCREELGKMAGTLPVESMQALGEILENGRQGFLDALREG